MTLTQILETLKVKKQQQQRTASSQYRDVLRALARDEELDADHVEALMAAVGKSHMDLATDVQSQVEKNEAISAMARHQQAHIDHRSAEAELLKAQQALNEAIAKLSPAIRAAEEKMRSAEHVMHTTAGAEARVMEIANTLDVELLAREQAIREEIKAVNAELAPLVKDRGFKLDSLRSSEFQLQRLQAREERTFMGDLVQWFNTPQAIKAESERVNDLQSQVAQLNQHIAPRQAKMDQLQAELAEIHRQKLEP